MRQLLPQSLAGRMLLALFLSFAALFTALLGIHDFLLRHALDWSTEELLAQRLATLVDAVAAAPEAARDSMVRALSGADLHVRHATTPPPVHPELLTEGVRHIAKRAEELLASGAQLFIRSGAFDPGSGHLVGIDAYAILTEGAVVTIEMTTSDLLSAELWWLYMQAAILGVVLLVVVGVAARTVTAPVTMLADGVSRLDPTRDGPLLSPSGPREVRQLAEAINSMAGRTRDSFRQRTIALGALSHDLISPIARLRLRSDDLPVELREPICKDLAEMETMVSDVLAYLRGGSGGETSRPLALASLVRTVVDEFADAGQVVELRGMDERVVVNARRVAVKRAVTNLLNNAVRHGRDPWIEVIATPVEATVCVGDRGAGIPDADLPHVTEPFFRGDRARSAGGGSGLGLATVQAIAATHGGDLRISNMASGGTVVVLALPLRTAVAKG